jgi:hypothetical protein
MFHDRNFTVESCLWRASYVQLESIVQRRRAADFVFPRHHKHAHMDRIRSAAIVLPSIHEDEISAVLRRARDDAATDLLSLGVQLPQQTESVSPPPIDENENEKLSEVVVEESELIPISVTGEDEEDIREHHNALQQQHEHWSLSLHEQEPFPVPPTWPLASAVLASMRKGECIASRPSRIIPVPHSLKTVSDGAGGEVDKRRACAIVSMHPSISADRVKRVQKMKRKLGE